MRALWLLPLLAACAAPADRPMDPERPQSVILYRDTVTARMPGGALCTAARDGGAGPWRGTFRGCPYPWGVQVVRTPDRPREPLVPSVSAPWVVIAAPEGPLSYGPEPNAGS